MQSAEMRFCENPADTLHFARNRRVLVQRQMRTGFIVICHARQEYVPKVPFAKHNDVVEYPPPDRANLEQIKLVSAVLSNMRTSTIWH
jgi:hypothetical protein